MKKFIFLSVAACMVLLLGPVQVRAAMDHDPMEDPTPVPYEVAAKMVRMGEIQDMDISLLTLAERRELRREVRNIEQDLKAYNGSGIYISVGAAILIVLLLILLL